MTPPAVALASCSKRYGERIALRRVTAAIAPGEIVALLGPNGSGKSTLLRLVAGLVRPSAGTVAIDGVASAEAPPAVRRRIGYVAHRSLGYRGLTARENLGLLARLHRLADGAVDDALAGVGLADRADDRVEDFSRGMAQRLSLARALLHDPDLLLLDEPSTGLDRDGLALLDRVVADSRGRRTVLVSTHDPAWAAASADRALEFRAGELR